MRTASRLLLTLCLAGLTMVVPAAASARTTWYSYGVLVQNAPVDDAASNHIARLTQILLPASFKVVTRQNYLAFGPVGTCRSTGSVRVVLVTSDAVDAASVVAEQSPPGTASYGSGTRGDAAWKIVKSGSATLRGAYARPALRLADTWVVVRIGTTPHATCHTGGYRESVAYPLADALATVKASGY